MSDLAARMTALTAEQRARLTARLRAAQDGRLVLPLDPAEPVVPASSSQQRMWFVEQLVPGTPLHTMSGIARVPLPLDVDAFRQCVQQVVARHDVLRTGFHLHEGNVVGRVLPEAEVPFRDLTGLTEEQVREQAGLDARTPFDLTAPPLLRIAVAGLADSQFLVVVTLSHLVSDGFSTGVLFAELGRLYRARTTGEGIAPVPFQFPAFAAWENARYAVASEGSAYWLDRLSSAPATSEWPADHPRQAVRSHAGRRLPVGLEPELVGRLRAAAAAWGVTPFAVVLAAFATTLYRWTGQADLVVGVPVANRGLPGADQVVGPFVNTLAVRLQLAEGDTFGDLVRHAQEHHLRALEHQDVPFDRVVEELRVRRDPGRAPVFQTMLNVETDRSAASGVEGVVLEEVHNGTSEFDLSLKWTLGTDRAQGHADYDTEVLDDVTVTAVVDALRAVLDCGLREPDRLLTHLPLTAASLAEAAVSGPPAPDDDPRTAVDMVLDRAAAQPSAVAIRAGDVTLTYAEVADLCRDVALRLHLAGVRPGDRVGSCLPRSADAVVAALGVMHAGAVYVPVDPTQPAARLAHVCTDAGMTAVLTRPDSAGAVPPGPWTVVDLAAGAPVAPSAAPAPTGVRHETAYALYTSGSTGAPKGALVRSDNLARFVRAMQADLALTPADVVLGVTSPSFDISLFDYIVTLSAGATLALALTQDVVDGARVATLLDRHDVTFMQATPATWQLLVDSGWRGRARLRTLSGGDKFPVPLAALLLQGCAEVWNGYGPTETTIYSHLHRVTAQDVAAGVLPVGPPQAGSTNLVLDAGGNPVPRGVLGELCIGGACVGDGYHGRPELTAQKFVELPGLPGRRFFRSGDNVRLGHDGLVRCFGRLDHQVKLRGFRIELGEVESVLDSAPGVARSVAVVVGTGDRDGGRLVAFCEPAEDGAALDTAAVLAVARAHLPAYMVPAALEVLTTFPLTARHKVDRAALQAMAAALEPATEPATARAAGRAAADDVEERLLAIWADVLGQGEVSMDDDFFARGGHSLLATQLLFRVKDAFGVDLPLQALFSQSATPAAMAGMVKELTGAAGEHEATDLVDLVAEARLDPQIRPEPGAGVHGVAHPQNAFVTGANGFLGAYLLQEIFTTTDATVFALVRAAGRADGLARVKAGMEAHGLWDDAYAARIVPVVGDLARPRLGLSRPAWEHLAETVDVIYHSGADVNFVRPYRSLRAANVLGTQEVLRLACTGWVKPVHFMSTIYVFDRFAYPDGTTYTEDLDPRHELAHTFGYTQSKWVSEQMVLEAGRRGVPVYVFRSGRIAGHSRTGSCQTYDFVWRATKVALAIGKAPVMGMPLDVTPVDWVVAATVHLSRQEHLAGRAFHVVHPQPVSEPAFVEAAERYGYRAEHLTFADWCAAVLEHAAQLSDETAGALAPFLTGTLPLDDWPSGDLARDNVEEGLRGSGITCPPVDDAMLRRYFDYFVSVGHLPPPDDEHGHEHGHDRQLVTSEGQVR